MIACDVIKINVYSVNNLSTYMKINVKWIVRKDIFIPSIINYVFRAFNAFTYLSLIIMFVRNVLLTNQNVLLILKIDIEI